MFLRQTPGKVILAILLGALTGDVIGEILRTFLPPSAAKEVLLQPVQIGLSPVTLDLLVAKFTFGFTLDFNLLAALFMFLMIFLLLKF